MGGDDECVLGGGEDEVRILGGGEEDRRVFDGGEDEERVLGAVSFCLGSKLCLGGVEAEDCLTGGDFGFDSTLLLCTRI